MGGPQPTFSLHVKELSNDTETRGGYTELEILDKVLILVRLPNPS